MEASISVGLSYTSRGSSIVGSSIIGFTAGLQTPSEGAFESGGRTDENNGAENGTKISTGHGNHPLYH